MVDGGRADSGGRHGPAQWEASGNQTAADWPARQFGDDGYGERDCQGADLVRVGRIRLTQVVTPDGTVWRYPPGTRRPLGTTFHLGTSDCT
ncbi:hypothetical protein Srubr_79050 [Streptomyces rubradiris]|uniref:Uncharacterized protein n=1 Tax=Streptomyces rubradiris TaxID=285531 RepID=A0ABQ3RQD9_STRRR|nr:hypothetical protein GCM10018792_73810 [Streptomyces rubradiris]GHI58059.1 hypothetical protein Srubr_79050 [Streptomyces rubradiris]